MLLMVFTVSMATLFCWMFYKRSKKPSLSSYLEKGGPKDTVILHQLGAGPHVPSISPFVMKVETYLRVAKIPYENRFDRKFGPKGKTPWIQYNDDVICDSQVIIQFLNEKFSKDLTKRMTSHQKAVGHVMRRAAEEWMYWSIVLHRLAFDPETRLYRQLELPAVIIWYLRRETAKRCFMQGSGRHTEAEVAQMTEQDLGAMSDIIGTNKFLFGNSIDDVTEIDCAVFGQLCELLWETPCCLVAEDATVKHPNLVKFCINMRDAFWPDWDDRLMKGGGDTTTAVNGNLKPTEQDNTSSKRNGVQPPVRATSSPNDTTPVTQINSNDRDILQSPSANKQRED